MSMWSMYTLKCPQCAKVFKAELWDGINVTLDPRLERLLFEGRLNVIRCPYCDLEIQVEKHFYYHDMVKRLFIYVYPASERHREEEIREGIEGELELFRRSGNDLPMHMQHYMIAFGFDEVYKILGSRRLNLL